MNRGSPSCARCLGNTRAARNKTNKFFLERNCCRLAHSHSRGKNYSLGFRPERALDLGNTGGNRANPSPTCPPDLYAIPVISLAAVPQQQRDREIIGADTLLGACPAGAQCIAADAGSDGKRRQGITRLNLPI